MGFFHFLFSLVPLLQLTCFPPVRGNAEVRALMELKASLDPTNKLLSSWTVNENPCSGYFEGVACNEHHKVANISLQGKGLTGTISPSIAHLKCLSGLYLHYNSLSGGIPIEIGNLTELSDLYLNVNNLSGIVPPDISNMAGLQVLQLCCNNLTGNLPAKIGSLKKLGVLSLQHNGLTGQIPSSLGDIKTLRRLDLSFNRLSGTLPSTLAGIPRLEVLDVTNNTLSGIVPAGLKKLNSGFQFKNNPGLCGDGFNALRACGPFDAMNINPFQSIINNTSPKDVPSPENFHPRCNQNYHCSHSSEFPRIAIIVSVISITVIISLVAAGFLTYFSYRRRKQKIESTLCASETKLSTDNATDFSKYKYSHRWENGLETSQELLNIFRFNVEEIESATQCFSEINLLGKSKFHSVYKGILRDESFVAVRRINITNFKSEETEFSSGLNLLTSLRHENLVKFRGFCYSSARGECFLVYNFAPQRNLSKFLDLEDGDNSVLDWSKRFSIVRGIAEGIGYLHRSETNKPAMVHQNLSVQKILLDQKFNALIADSGLSKILADDIVFSALKNSAAMGYLAPEYVITGRFTDKSDIYAFGVMILQIISGQQLLTNKIRSGAASCMFEDFIDLNLREEFSLSEAAILAKIATICTNDVPEQRPTMEIVIQAIDGCENQDCDHFISSGRK